MQLAYATKNLRDYCEGYMRMERRWGDQAKAIFAALDQLRQASTVYGLVPRPELSADIITWEVVPDKLFVQFRPNHYVVPRIASGFVDWLGVTYIQILAVVVRPDLTEAPRESEPTESRTSVWEQLMADD